MAGEYGLRQEGIRQAGQLKTAEARAREVAAGQETTGQQAMSRQQQAQGFASGERTAKEQFASGENRLNRQSRAAIERDRQAAIGARTKKPTGLLDFWTQLLGRRPEPEMAAPVPDDPDMLTGDESDVMELDLTPEQLTALQNMLSGR